MQSTANRTHLDLDGDSGRLVVDAARILAVRHRDEPFHAPVSVP
jgi:hypothetical protein